MPNDSSPILHSATDGGISAKHASADSLEILAAPATSGEFNTARLRLIPVACWRVDDVRFPFDSSFVTPDISAEMAALADLLKQHPGSPLSIFGHADPVGSDDYNKVLSGRRATSIYSLLTRNTQLWQQLHDQPQGNDRWGDDTLKTMEAATGLPKGTSHSTLFLAYMDKICGKDFKLAKSDFLAQGADPGGKGDFQGCGEFNPTLVFSSDENQKFQKSDDKTLRNRANAPNRRVVIFLFRKGSRIEVSKWPCPKATEGVAACHKRFWSDGDKRRAVQDVQREFSKTKDTFACRFYHRLATSSPCEVIAPTLWPIAIKGKLFWNRTWDFNDDKKPIGAIKEYLPGARVELRVQKLTDTALTLHSSVFLNDDGEFKFTNVPECSKAALRIFLEYVGGAVVCVKGLSNAVTQPDFEIKTGSTVWHQKDLDVSKMNGRISLVDLADIEINKPHFVDICDAYKSVWFGHKKLKDMADVDLPICQINYPEPTTSTSNASTQMNLLKDDLKDRDVILHEYGHFIGTNILGGLNHPGYGYNDDATGQHSRNSKEHYESAWNEGHATFLSCALQDDPIYHDGYDTYLTYKLDSDNTQVGPHSEGSIQEALWRIYKVHKTPFKEGFWKVFSDKSKRTVRTIFDFWLSWKELGVADLDKLVESYKKFNLEFGYNYLDGAGRFTAVAAPKKFDKAKKEFTTVDELYNAFGILGSGTLAAYNEEFYNRNKQFNPGSLAGGSKIATPKVTAGKTYIVPERMQVTK